MFCSKTGGAIIGLLVSKQDGMVFSSSPTLLSLVRVNQPIPILMQGPKDMREKSIEPEIYREVKVTNNALCVVDHNL